MFSSYFHSPVDTGGLLSSNSSTPFYYNVNPTSNSHFSNKGLALLAPIITYWSIYLLYRLFLLLSNPKPRRLFNLQTLRLVAEIQIVQTLFGWVWLTRFGKEHNPGDLTGDLQRVARFFGVVLPCLVGKVNAQQFLNRNGEELVHFTYWWAIPVAKQFLASFVVDAWQALLYFIDIDRYLYADVHAFLFDTLGVCLGYTLSGITNREAIVFLSLSTLSTFGNHPRRMRPAISLHPCIPLDREVIYKPGGNVPFMGFRRQLYELAHWYILTLNMHSLETRRIQRAIHTARHQRTMRETSRARPRLRLNTSCM